MGGSAEPLISTRPKIIYFAEKRAGFSAAQFKARWREHGQLGMSLPRWRNIYRYCQCDPVRDLPPLLPSLGCDGVAMIWYRSEAARQRHVSDEGRAVMRQDETETFARPVAQFSWLAIEGVYSEISDPMMKLFIQLRRRTGGSEDVVGKLSEHAGLMLATLEKHADAFGYSSNAQHPAWSGGVACDGIDEIALPRSSVAGIADIVSAVTEAYAGSAFSCIGSVWTEENELYRVSDDIAHD